MYFDEDTKVVFIGGTTLGVFAFFIIALIARGLEYIMDLVTPFVTILLIIEPIVALIFILIILTSCYNSKSEKVAKIIVAVICTAVAIITTLVFKEIMSGCIYDNPGLFDIFVFAITGLFFGGICAISLTGWFMALLASTDGDATDMLSVACLYEILPLIILIVIIKIL